MTFRELTVRTASSRLALRTRAKGMLARLAHDLEIASTELTGRVRASDGAWSGELLVPIGSLRVAGTLHGDKLDPSALSPSDRQDIERRMRGDVLAAERELVVELSGPTRERGEAVLVIAGGQRTRIPLTLRTRELEGGAIAVSGRAEISLKAQGIAEIRAPLGAFKVSDTVEVLVELELQPV
jgi:hypothetical protein